MEYDWNVLNRIFKHILQQKGWYLDYSAFKTTDKKSTDFLNEKMQDTIYKQDVLASIRFL